jgi:hypothetical protein
MTSVELVGPTPARFQTIAAFGFAAAGIVLLGLAVWGFRSWQAGRKYRDFASGRELDDEPLTEEGVSLTPITKEASIASEEPIPLASIAPESLVSKFGTAHEGDNRRKPRGKPSSLPVETGYNTGLDDQGGDDKALDLDDDEDLAV